MECKGLTLSSSPSLSHCNKKHKNKSISGDADRKKGNVGGGKVEGGGSERGEERREKADDFLLKPERAFQKIGFALAP